MKRDLICCLFVAFSYYALTAQNTIPSGSWRFEVRTPCNMSLRVDSLSVVPGSFHIYDVPDSAFFIDAVSATLYLRDSSLLHKSLLMSYSVFNMDFSVPIRHRSSEMMRVPAVRPVNPVSSLATMADMMNDEQLYSSGSLSRGVSVGNNSDLVLNSSLNLQLSGKLSEDVSILASITDKNIPVQPEGTTQNIRDINSIFINIYYKNLATLKAGDIEMKSPMSDFLVVSKKIIGLDFAIKSSPNEKLALNNVVGGGVAKGKFVRQNIVPQNGVQGPYRLYGKDNELNIVVVAGSERVFVDGVLMTRGQDNDYVMDYNTAEITFTPAMLITTEKRIVVEMEYTDRNYVRYNIYNYNEILLGKNKQWKLNVNFYQEQDLKNQSIQPELTNDQKLFLSALGDNETQALYHTADTMQFSADRILYSKIDTVAEGVAFSGVYVYSVNEQEALYALSFTYVGAGKGNYVLLRSTSNGRVFGWVAPVDGVCQGDYEPVVQLTTPKLMQMATLAAAYNSSKGTSLHTEFAISNLDRNIFSKLDDRDNVGFAYTLNARHRQWIGRDSSSVRKWQLNTSLGWQFVNEDFSEVESFREVEFARNYNLNEQLSNAYSEQMLSASLAVNRVDGQLVCYDLNWFSRLKNVNVLRQEVNAKLQTHGLAFQTRTSFLVTRDSIQHSNFWVSDNKLSYAFKKLEIGVADMMEHNVFRDARVDTLRANTYAFNELVSYLKNRDSAWCNYSISYKNRLEFQPMAETLRLEHRIHEVNGRLQIEKLKNQHIAIRATYRTQQLLTDRNDGVPEHFFVGNAEYTGRFLKNALVLSTYYEAGTGLEQEKIFSFLKVAKGQGTHVWIDYNGDEVEELGEFEIAAFQDEAEYVKVWLSSTEYRNTYNSQFTQSVQIRPAAAWSSKKGVKRFFARFSDVAMFRSQVKQQNLGFNPFSMNLADSNLVSKAMSYNNTFSFNRSTSPFAFDFILQGTQNKNLLYYGYEYNQSSAQQLVLKSAPCRALYVQVAGIRSVNGNNSQCMEGRDYRLLQYAVSGDAQLQFQNRYVAEVKYAYRDKSNTESVEKIREQEVELSLSVKMAKKGVLTGSASYIGIDGDAGRNSAVSYQLLQGLNVGNNAVWSLSYQMAVSGYLQIMLQYDGRVSQGHRSVHTGSLTVKAQF